MSMCCISFTYAEALGHKFDHVIKMVKVNHVSAFEQMVVLHYMYPMLYTMFHGNRPLGSAERDF